MNFLTNLLILLVVNYYLCDCVVIDYDNPIVDTLYGQVRGKPYIYSSSETARHAVAFIGVPYANPPTGINRFRSPQPPDSWFGEVKDCTNNRIMCPQIDQRFNFQLSHGITESEDCLYLNIYVPVSNNQFTQNLPILVYFHGGEFKFGGKDFYKPDFLLENSMVNANPGMIIVTVNYRLGIFGFLSSGDIHQPGNNGIRDQVQALKWIRENIRSFNGNPNNVTIMGHDAGAISVSILVLNQEAWPYFDAAISIGGSAFTPWAFEHNPKQQSIDFGNFFKCDLRRESVADCLRDISSVMLIAKSRDRDWDNNRQKYWFRPVIDRNISSSAILKDYPLNLYKNGRFKQCPYILGFTKNEGSLEYYLQRDRVSNRHSIDEKISFLIRPFLREEASEEIIASAIKYSYFSQNRSRIEIDKSDFNTEYINLKSVGNEIENHGVVQKQERYELKTGEQEDNRIFVELMGDLLYISACDIVARLHSSFGSQTWMYVFEYEGTKSFGPLQRNASEVSSKTYGVTHMDDIFYLLPNEYILDTNSQINDKNMANIYAKLIATLVQTGTIPTGSYGTYGWQQYTTYNPNYLVFPRAGSNPIAVHVSEAINGYRIKYLDFFNGFIRELQDITNGYSKPYSKKFNFEIKITSND